MQSSTRKFSSIVLIACILFLVPVGDARADLGETLFALLKEYHPDKDSIEFARYYVYNPEHGDVIYTKIAAQEYPFIAILAAAKAAKNQKILPGGQTFGYDQCMTPITMFNAIFAKSGDYINKYGQEEHIKGYMNAQNDEAKKEAENQLADYVPYWKEIPDICHFTFNSDFQDEKHLRETIAGSWKLIRGAYEDFGSGNVASGVAKLLQTGVTGGTACMLADNAISGGAIGKIPVLGGLAKSVCAGFAGALIKGIGTVVGAVVNAVGEFIGDAACTSGIGSCTGNKPVDGIYNSNFQMIVFGYSTVQEAEVNAWATNWFDKVMGPKCHNQTGANGTTCANAFNQMVASARVQAINLGNEAGPAYQTIYAPALNEIAIAPIPLLKLIELDTICSDNLRAKYPVPGPQQIDPKDDRKVYQRPCQDARTRAEFGGGKSFDQALQEQTAAFQAAIGKTDCKVAAGGKRTCRSFPSLKSCTSIYGAYGVVEGTALQQYCAVDAAAATVNVAWAVAMKAAGCAAQKGQGGNYLTTCGTYAGYRSCIKTVQATPGAPPDLILGCKLDSLAARTAVVNAMSAGLGAPGSAASNGGCTLSAQGNAFTCKNEPAYKQCRSLLAMHKEMPAGAVWCGRKLISLPPGGVVAPPGGTVVPTPGGAVVSPPPGPKGGAQKIPIILIPTNPAAQETAPTPQQVAGSLARLGCREVRPGMFSCTTQRGVDVCDRYRAKGQARACRLVQPK